ncbi:MAG: hypothetical protein ACYDD1_20825 [Caulobacteraceae bacterium]
MSVSANDAVSTAGSSRVVRRNGLGVRPFIDRIASASAGDSSVFTHGQRWLLLLLFTLLLVFRLPKAWLQGRFMDEDATVFLAYAWHHPWRDALFRPFGGYLNLAANASTLLVAALVKGGALPLARAPYATMCLALISQVLPAALLLFGRASWLSNRLAVITAVLLLGLCPGVEETFFNAMHIQFHLALCVGIILSLDPPQRTFTRISYNSILFLAPLCGPIAIIMWPLFTLRAMIDRDRTRAVQCATLAAGAAIQLLLFFSENPMRSHPRDPGTIAAVMFIRLLALPLTGFNTANAFGAMIYFSKIAGGPGWWCAAAFAVLAFGALIALAARRIDAASWLVLAGLSVAVATFGFGMVVPLFPDLFNCGDGERYNLLPLTLLSYGLLALAMRPGERGRAVYAALCMLMLGIGVAQYRTPMKPFADGPSWIAEVDAWKRDHRHPLKVWPGPWAADLSDTTYPCLSMRDSPRSKGPRYCESSWTSGFDQHPMN